MERVNNGIISEARPVTNTIDAFVATDQGANLYPCDLPMGDSPHCVFKGKARICTFEVATDCTDPNKPTEGLVKLDQPDRTLALCPRLGVYLSKSVFRFTNI